MLAPHADAGASVDMSCIFMVHLCIPGRVRVCVDGLRGSDELAHGLRSLLVEQADILRVQASATTGNVTVVFGPMVEPALVIERIAICRTLLSDGAEHHSNPEPEWHCLTADEVALRLETSVADGLTFKRAKQNLKTVGPNELSAGQVRSRAEILAEQFSGAPVVMLGLAAAISLATGALLEAGAIGAVLLVNAAIGYVTEQRAEAVVASLGNAAAEPVEVLRGGEVHAIAPRELVPGDVMLLRRGDIVQADARLIRSQDLSVSEAALTGESLPVRKRVEALPHNGVVLASRTNMLYRGTFVINGSGAAIVVATGSATELGRVQRLVNGSRAPETPTQQQLGALGHKLVWLTAGAAGVLLVLGLMRGIGALRMMRSALSLAVASIPEGLPMIATTAHALGVEAMRGQDILMRRLDAVETLASVDVMCFDKTGTLTENRMSLVEVVCAGGATRVHPAGDHPQQIASAPLMQLLKIGTLCSEVEVNGNGDSAWLQGSATEVALVRCALDHGIDIEALRKEMPCTWIRQRTDSARFMVSFHADHNGAGLTAMKGSPPDVLRCCRDEFLPDGRTRPLTDARRAAIERENASMAGRGLRVLGFAFAERVDPTGGHGAQVSGMTWVGLGGLADPIRPSAADAIAELRLGGLRPLILTGDQWLTAKAVAAEIGLADADDRAIVNASSLDGLSDAELTEVASKAALFAQVTPAQKLRIVEALQRAGSVVAMVGDGINDSPALRKADVGIAMSLRGDVAACEVADMLLRTDDLRRLSAAVQQGRTTYRNVRKSLRFLMGTNSSEVMLMLGGTAAGMGEVLSPVQLLWINLMTDVAPGIGLAMEPPEADALSRPPQPRDAPLLGPAETARLVSEGSAMAAGAFAASLYGSLRYGKGAPQIGTLAFGSLIGAQLQHAATCRAEPGSRDAGARPENRALNLILAGSAVAQSATVLFPPLRRLLGLAPLSAVDTAVMAACSVLPAVFCRQGAPALLRAEREEKRAAVSASNVIRFERRKQAQHGGFQEFLRQPL